MRGRVVEVARAGDVALLCTDWEGSSVDASGPAIEHSSRAIEVLRLQPDGTWQLIVGDPSGRS